MTSYSPSIIATLLVTLSLSACGGGGGDTQSAPQNDSPPAGVAPPAGSGTPVGDLRPFDPAPLADLDNFDFQIEEQFASGETDFIVQSIQRQIGSAVAPMNEIGNVLSNTTVPVTYGSCDEANAFYVPSLRQIFLCHELSLAAFNFFLDDGTTDDEREIAMSSALRAITHVMYHEMGHALDDLTGLNVGGNFESAADAIAVVLAMQTGQPRVAAFGGFFTLASGQESLFDEHGSGVDRAGDILCWAIGGSPRLTTSLPNIAQDFTDAGRDCVGEYASQFAFVEDLIPDLRSIPQVASIRSRRLQTPGDRLAERPADRLAELDEKNAAALKGL